MYYFAYGSNLNHKQMLERCPDSKPGFLATLHNYRRVFAGWSRQWRDGVASIKSGQLEEAPPAREYLAVIQRGYRDWGIT